MAAAQELDHLFTRISLDARGYLTPAKEVIAATGNMEAAVERFADVATAAFTRVQTRAAAVAKGISSTLGAQIQALTSAAAALGSININIPRGTANELTILSDTLANMEAPNTRRITSMVNNLDKLSGAITAYQAAGQTGDAIGKDVQRLSAGLAKVQAVDGNAVNSTVRAVTKISDVLTKKPIAIPPDLPSGLRGLFRSLGAMEQVPARVVNSVVNAIDKIGASLTNLPGTFPVGFGREVAILSRSLSKLDPPDGRKVNSFIASITKLGGVAGSLTAVSTAMSGFKAVNARAVQSVSQSLDNLVNSFATYASGRAGANVGMIASELTQFARSMTLIAGLGKQLAPLATSFNRIANLLFAVNNFKPGNLKSIIPEIQGFATALGGIGGGRGGAGPPVVPTLRALPQAGKAAADSFTRMEGAAASLNSTSRVLGNTLAGVRLSLLGVTGFGLFGYAKSEEELLRATGQMRQQGTGEPGAFGAFRRASMTAAAKSPIGVVEQSQALRLLAESGFSAGAAIDALSTAENFAVASGMKMADATKKLIDTQISLGLTSEASIERHQAGMQKVADMLVTGARAAGTTEAMLADSITGRLTTAMSRTRMEAEEAVAMVTVLSRLSKSFRGSVAGDTAARGIAMLTEAAATRTVEWRKMGINAVDAEGKFINFLDALEQINEKFVGPNRMESILQLQQSGIGTDLKTVNAIELMLRYAKTMKEVRDRLVDSGGAAQMMADHMRMSLGNQMKQLWNSTMAVATVFGERLAPALYTITQPLTQMMVAFTELNPAVQALIVYTVTLVAAFRPLMTVLTFVGSVLLAPVAFLIGSMITLAVRTVAFGFAIRAAWLVTSAWVVATWTAAAASNAMATAVWLIRGAFYGAGVAITAVFTAFKTGQAFLYIFIGAVTAMLTPLALLATAFTGLTWLIGKAFTGAVFLVQNFGKIMAAVATAIVTTVINLAAGFATLVATLIVVVPLLAIGFGVIAGPVATLVIGITQLVELIGVGLVSAWDATRDAAAGALGWVGGKAQEIGAGVSSMWEMMRESSQQFFQSARVGFERLAGFFWNFSENAKIIFASVRKHGDFMFADIVNVAFDAVKIMTWNLTRVFMVVVDSISIVFKSLWITFTSFGQTALAWLRGQWLNIGLDIGKMFGTIMTNMMHNISVMIDFAFLHIARYVRDLTEAPLGRTFGTEEAKNTFLRERATEDAVWRGITQSRLVGPLAGMKGLKTDFGELQTMMGTTSAVNSKVWNSVGRQIAQSFAQRIGEMNPILKAFSVFARSPVWQELFGKLNTKLPDDLIGQLMKFYNQMVHPELGDEDKEAQIISKQGPGFTFKQSSEARMMIGGEAMFTLQMQQLLELKAIRGFVADIAGQEVQIGGPGKAPLIRWREE